MPTTEAAELQARVDEVPFWWHSIDLGHGVVTPGGKSPDLLRVELGRLGLEDLRGKSVLDIGALDGYFAFAAERMGADRVVALDHFMWSFDLAGWMNDRASRLAQGLPVAEPDASPEFWHRETMPGRRGFDLAHEVLGSQVEVVVADLLDCDLEALGTFDLVLYLGVLYHMRHPLLALERLVQVTRGVAVIETHAESFRASERRALGQFFEGDELNGDPTNWWGLNVAALLAMCRVAGFERAEPPSGRHAEGQPTLPRLCACADIRS
jgi:tRNA (mo5U34)-methyltransferase